MNHNEMEWEAGKRERRAEGERHGSAHMKGSTVDVHALLWRIATNFNYCKW